MDCLRQKVASVFGFRRLKSHSVAPEITKMVFFGLQKNVKVKLGNAQKEGGFSGTLSLIDTKSFLCVSSPWARWSLASRRSGNGWSASPPLLPGSDKCRYSAGLLTRQNIAQIMFEDFLWTVYCVVSQPFCRTYMQYLLGHQGDFNCSSLPATLGGNGEFEREFEEIEGNLKGFEKK